MHDLTAAPSRIFTLDIVRGVAVMGILAMNIIAFAMPDGAYMNPAAYGGHRGADLGIWLVNFVTVDGKMRGLFSFLFGASMLLVVQSAATKGENPARVHYARMFWLLVFGLIHMYLIWWGDILSHYALIGSLAFLFRNKPVKALLRWGIALLAVQMLVMTSFAFFIVTSQAAASAPGASAEAVSTWAQLSGSFGPLAPDALAKDLALHRGSYATIVADRVRENMFLPLGALFQFGWETLAYMLFGMAALKSGFLTGAWEVGRYRKWAAIGYAISIPAYAAAAAVVIRSGFDPATTALAGTIAPTLIRPAMIVAHAALIILVTRHGGGLTERLAATGRAAFTNYLGTSIIVSTIFYGYGLGLYGHLSRIECYGVVAGVWALMLLWSKPWLEHYRFGPLEWLWRSLARMRVQPMRKVAAA